MGNIDRFIDALSPDERAVFDDLQAGNFDAKAAEYLRRLADNAIKRNAVYTMMFIVLAVTFFHYGLYLWAVGLASPVGWCLRISWEYFELWQELTCLWAAIRARDEEIVRCMSGAPPAVAA